MIEMRVDASKLLASAGAQVKAIEAALIQTTVAEGDEIEKLFLKTTEHWSKNQFAGFTKASKVTPKEATMTVGTDDRIYAFINYGTSERYAVMSSDWSSQTTPRVIGSQPGQGMVIARGRRAVPNPMPGIEARHFDEEIAKQRAPIYYKNLNAAAIAAAKRTS